MTKLEKTLFKVFRIIFALLAVGSLINWFIVLMRTGESENLALLFTFCCIVLAGALTFGLNEDAFIEMDL